MASETEFAGWSSEVGDYTAPVPDAGLSAAELDAIKVGPVSRVVGWGGVVGGGGVVSGSRFPGAGNRSWALKCLLGLRLTSD